MDFLNLSTSEQKEYFESLGNIQKKQLINSLEVEDLKKFISSYTNEYDRRRIYPYFDRGLLKKYLESLSPIERKIFLESVQNMQIELSERKNESINTLEANVANINTKEKENTTSKEHIVELRQDIKNLKEQIKKNKVELRQLDRDRKKKLAAQIRASKPSVLDRVGFISKYRASRLVEKTKEFEQAERIYQQMVDKDNFVRNSLEQAKDNIEVEKQRIKDAKQSIEESKSIIYQERENIKEVDIQIKRLSKEEKKALGKKLYGQRIDTRNRIMVVQKNVTNQQQENFEKTQEAGNQNMQQENEQVVETTINLEEQSIEQTVDNKANLEVKKQPTQVKVTKKTSTKATTDAMKHFFDEMSKAGISFPSNPEPINNIQDGELLKNAVENFNYPQAITAIYMMGYMAAYMAEMQQQMNNEASKTRGFISITVLVGLIFTLCNIILYVVLYLN